METEAVIRFTSCYDQDSTQEEIFTNDVEPMVDVVYNGVVSRPLMITVHFEFIVQLCRQSRSLRTA
jgi:hypothetical protein